MLDKLKRWREKRRQVRTARELASKREKWLEADMVMNPRRYRKPEENLKEFETRYPQNPWGGKNVMARWLDHVRNKYSLRD